MSCSAFTNSRFLTLVLTILGLRPVFNGTGSWFARYYRCYQLCLHIGLTFSLSLLMWLDVILNTNLKHATQALKIVLTLTVIVAKVFNTCYYASRAARLLHELEMSNILALHTHAEREMWRRTQSYFRKVVVVYMIWSISACFFAFSSIFFMDTPDLPFPYWVPQKWRESNAWPLYLYDFFAILFTCMCNTEIDLYQCYFLLLLTLCLRLIGLRLERLGGAGADVGITRELVQLIEMHRQVKDMTKRCEKIISLPVLTQIVLSSLIICFTIYYLQSASFSANPADFFAMIQYFIAMSLQVYLPCYFANELTLVSQSLSKHLYSCDWIGMSAYNRRLIFLYMGYLKQPLVLRAGNYFEIGLPVFSKVMNNAYSLLALLVNVSDDGK